jgi:hypothetical protein
LADVIALWVTVTGVGVKMEGEPAKLQGVPVRVYASGLASLDLLQALAASQGACVRFTAGRVTVAPFNAKEPTR